MYVVCTRFKFLTWGYEEVLSFLGSDYFDFHFSSEGTDNPFRPDGDLSREADELVHLIKEGRPFSEVVKPGSPSQSESHDQVDSLISPEKETILLATPPASPIKNGSMTQVAPVEAPPSPKSVPVEVQHGIIVPPSGDGQVERVMLKKKKKKCCVVM